MPIFKFEAENVSRRKLAQLIRELEAKGITVPYADMECNFTNCVELIITARERVADDVQNRIWEINNGRPCDMYEISKEDLNWHYA